MYGKRKSGVFFAVRVGFQVNHFWKFHSAGTCVTSSQHSNVQVTITVTCLNFAVTGSQILLHPLSSSRRVKPSRKIALNSNWEVNCRELARRPWSEPSLVQSFDQILFIFQGSSLLLLKRKSSRLRGVEWVHGLFLFPLVLGKK